MRTHLTRPKELVLRAYVSGLQAAPYSYKEVGATRGEFPPAYLHSHDRFYLGHGEQVWQCARQLIQSWQMFPADWTFIYPATPPQPEEVVAVCFRQFSIWWKNACRIVYCTDEPHAYGFAYGTLPTHVGNGEEYFGVERDEQGDCWYIIKAFSLPLYWGTRLFPAYMRLQQRSFIAQSGLRMQTLINEHLNTKRDE